MSTTTPILPSLDDRHARHATALFTVTATLTFALTGIGMFRATSCTPPGTT